MAALVTRAVRERSPFISLRPAQAADEDVTGFVL